jgi:hypothetical protein
MHRKECILVPKSLSALASGATSSCNTLVVCCKSLRALASGGVRPQFPTETPPVGFAPRWGLGACLQPT